MKIFVGLILLISVLLAGCGGGGGEIVPAAESAVWAKYGLKKPSPSSIITSASDNFKSYTATIRNDQAIKVLAQTGVDATLTAWVQDGAKFVATRFNYPKFSKPFLDVIAIDEQWLLNTYISEGFSNPQSQSRVVAFRLGAPAFGGSDTNTWNYATINSKNLLVTDKVGMAQTPGHELFHAIQETLAKGQTPGPKGELIPNWYWEGAATFVGLQTADGLKVVDYLTLGRPNMVVRFKNGPVQTRSLNLSEIKANDSTTDPYAIGFSAIEFLVSQVGMQKMIDVCAALGSGKNFGDAFKQGTGIELVDFYAMFDEVRGGLEFSKN